MPRNLTPLDDKLTSPTTIGDRSKLAALYERPAKSVPVQDDSSHESPDVPVSPLGFLDTIIINLLVSLPYISSFLSVSVAYTLPEPVDVHIALENRILLMVLAVTFLGPWVYALPTLYKKLWNYRVRFSGVIALYAFFLFPILAISIKLHQNGVPDIITLLSTFILSQCYIWLITYAFRERPRPPVKRFAPLLIMIGVLILGAALYR